MPRSRELSARERGLAALLAALLGACAADSHPAAPPPAASAAPAAALAPAPAPAPAAAAPRAPRPLGDFRWPEPLPPCSPDAPYLFKGSIIGTWVPEGDAGFERAW